MRIIPRIGLYGGEVLYEQEPQPAALAPALHAGSDSGLNHVAARTADNAPVVPRIVNGRPVKSINQFYHKRRAQLQSQLCTAGTSNRLERITTNRTRRIDHSLHTASRRLIELLVAAGIGTLCSGNNPTCKQEVHLGRRTHQTCGNVSHARFIAMLTYKAEVLGIQVLVTEQRYTSTASLLAADPLPIYDAAKPVSTVSGRRVQRGLFRAADGRHLTADVNGAYTSMRTAAPDAFALMRGQGRSGCVVHPVRLAAETTHSCASDWGL